MRNTEQITIEAFKYPKVGDVFQDMYTYWVIVVGVHGNTVTTTEASGSCKFPDDGVVKTQTKKQFRDRFRYKNIPGYMLTLEDRGCLVRGWRKKGRINE